MLIRKNRLNRSPHVRVTRDRLVWNRSPLKLERRVCLFLYETPHQTYQLFNRLQNESRTLSSRQTRVVFVFHSLLLPRIVVDPKNKLLVGISTQLRNTPTLPLTIGYVRHPR